MQAHLQRTLGGARKNNSESLELENLKLDLYESEWYPEVTPAEREAYARDWETLTSSLPETQTARTTKNAPIKRNDFLRFLDGTPLVTLGLVDKLLPLVVNRIPFRMDLDSVQATLAHYYPDRSFTKSNPTHDKEFVQQRSKSLPGNTSAYALSLEVGVGRQRSITHSIEVDPKVIAAFQRSQTLGPTVQAVERKRDTNFVRSSEYKPFLLKSPNMSIQRHEFDAVCFLLTRYLQGYPCPHDFPLEYFSGFSSQLLGLEMPPVLDGCRLGSKLRPLSYRDFAYIFRPLLEEAFRAKRRHVWKKTALIASMWVPVNCKVGQVKQVTKVEGHVETFSKVGARFRTCNIETPSMESWSIKPENFTQGYEGLSCPVTGEEVVIPSRMLDPPAGGGSAGAAIKEHLLKYVREEDLPCIDWDKLSKVLLEQRILTGEDGPWKLARAKGLVVGIELTPELLQDTFMKHGIDYELSFLQSESVQLFREETYHPKYAFKPGDYLVGDLLESKLEAALTNCNSRITDFALTSIQEFKWKQGNAPKSGQTLITRTVDRSSFLSTFNRLEDLDQRMT